MKKMLLFVIAALMIGIMFTGFSLSDAHADAVWTPESSCAEGIATSQLYYGDDGSFYRADLEACYMRHSDGEIANQCYPAYDVNKAVWQDTPEGRVWTWQFVGCVAQP
jgi:hypothetical protein